MIPDKDKLSCIEIDIKNCAIPDVGSKGPNFKCKQCNVGFYVNADFKCTAVPEQIEYCGIYETSHTCALCFNNYVLLSNKKKCVLSNEIQTYIDSNCLNSFISPDPICNLCMPGYYFEVDPKDLLTNTTNETVSSGGEDSDSDTDTDTNADTNADTDTDTTVQSKLAKVGLLLDDTEKTNKNCVPCPNNEGCAQCYPKNPSFCLICKPGYTHNSNGTCLETDPEDDPGPIITSAFIFSIELMFVLVSFYVM